ncbi:hypothetical protein [Microvirga sp. 2TAF3]|uniref:hypothetical protein n=1 Tax=Microvirga sp. 2TAF3 TaxID=3233014 RepID=UPI003F9A7609
MRFMVVSLITLNLVAAAVLSSSLVADAVADSQLLARAVQISKFSVDSGDTDRVVAIIRSFADDNKFAIRVDNKTGPTLMIELWRADVMIVVANPFNPSDFEVGFYDVWSKDSEHRNIDALYKGLKKALSTLPGVKFRD